MRDPVITPSGVTYERAALQEHLSLPGAVDPVTREPLSIRQLTPNRALKETIDKFRADNPWVDLMDDC